MSKKSASCDVASVTVIVATFVPFSKTSADYKTKKFYIHSAEMNGIRYYEMYTV